MTKERSQLLETVIATSSLIVIAQAILGAFSIKTRKEIGKRDNWTCQGCGKEFYKGWMVDAAHSPEHHRKSDPMYDHPSSGDIRCLDCHEEQHRQGTTLGKRDDVKALRMLKNRDRHTYKWRKQPAYSGD